MTLFLHDLDASGVIRSNYTVEKGYKAAVCVVPYVCPLVSCIGGYREQRQRGRVISKHMLEK
jgi:hypothetical protein